MVVLIEVLDGLAANNVLCQSHTHVHAIEQPRNCFNHTESNIGILKTILSI